MCERIRRPSVATLLGVIPLVFGCSGSNPDLALLPAQGTVLVDGKPASYAAVQFVPVDEDQREASTATGEANEDGEFQLYTRNMTRGVKPGEYYVAVSWRIPENPRSSDDPCYSNELLPTKYQDPVNSGIKLEISADEAELPPIELKP